MVSMKILIINIIREFQVYCSYKSIEEIELKWHISLEPVKGFKLKLESRKKNSLIGIDEK